MNNQQRRDDHHEKRLLAVLLCIAFLPASLGGCGKPDVSSGVTVDNDSGEESGRLSSDELYGTVWIPKADNVIEQYV